MAAKSVTDRLSEAERRVFELLLTGQPEKGIARRLDLSPHTVHNHVRAILRAFHVHSRAELLAELLRNGQTTIIGADHDARMRQRHGKPQ
jgi:DNA-binding NarL/FixJ family response regulator